jgi:serine/threonine protein kinase
MRHQTCSEKVDVWSYAVVLWELLLCEAPFMVKFENNKLIFGVGSGTLRLHIPRSIPNGLKLLLQQCLNYKPRNRPSFNQIIKHLDVSLENDSEILKNDLLYLKLQNDEWKVDVRNHYENVAKEIERDHQLQQHNDYDLVQRREEELQHAANIREYYEERLQKANNLYFELSAVLLQLEQREEAIVKKEDLLNIKIGGKNRIVKSLIKREFQQKAKSYSNKVLNKLNIGNQKNKPVVAQQVVCNMEPLCENIPNVNNNNKTTTTISTSNEAPMSYEKVMKVEADKSEKFIKYEKKTLYSTRRCYKRKKKSPLFIRRRTTTNDNDDQGFQADTEEDDNNKHQPNYHKRYNLDKIINDEKHRRKHNRRFINSSGVTEHDDYDIDRDNIEDVVYKKKVLPDDRVEEETLKVEGYESECFESSRV